MRFIKDEPVKVMRIGNNDEWFAIMVHGKAVGFCFREEVAQRAASWYAAATVVRVRLESEQ